MGLVGFSRKRGECRKTVVFGNWDEFLFFKNLQGRVGKTTKGPVWLLTEIHQGYFCHCIVHIWGKVVLLPGRFSYQTKIKGYKSGCWAVAPHCNWDCDFYR